MRHDPIDVHRRNLPHWTRDDSTYFLTFRVAVGELSPTERDVVLSHLRAGDGRFYRLLAAVVMPDHCHALLKPNPGIELSRITKGVKGVSAHLVNIARGTGGMLWQDESFDRLVRDDAEFAQKWNYIVHNPVTRGLVDRPDEYPWLFLNDHV